MIAVRTVVTNILNNTDLKYNKSLHLFYGKYKGYNIFIKLDINKDLCYVFFTVKHSRNVKKYIYSEEDLDYIDNDINNSSYSEKPYMVDDIHEKDIQNGIILLKATSPMLQSITYKDNEIICVIEATDDSFVLSLYTILNDIVQFCNDNNLVPCCINCGKPKKTVQYSINEYFVNVCNYCYNSVYFDFANKPKPEYTASESFISGSLGVLIGVLFFSLFLFSLNIITGNSYIMGFTSLILIIPVIICIKLYKIFSGGFFTKKSIIITGVLCLIAIFPILILSEAYIISKDIKENFDKYVSEYQLRLEKDIEESYEDIIKKYESTENYLKKNIEDYKEYLISYKEISQAFKSVLNDLEHNRKFRYLFIKKIRWCIAWLCLTIICISFYKYNYDKKVDSILLC